VPGQSGHTFKRGKDKVESNADERGLQSPLHQLFWTLCIHNLHPCHTAHHQHNSLEGIAGWGPVNGRAAGVICGDIVNFQTVGVKIGKVERLIECTVRRRNASESTERSIRLYILRVSILLALISTCAAAQVSDNASACGSPEAVLQRYVDAVGGKAVDEIQSRTIIASESNKGFGTEHYIYKIKWKAPNRVAVGSTPYLFNILPVSYPNGTFIFDGKGWSNFDRRRSRNDERDPQWQRELKARYPYNEGLYFLELRVVADPLIITRAHELYSGFVADTNATEAPGFCVLRANQVRVPLYERQDILYFDAVTGLLRTWKIHAGFPPLNTLVEFQFDDYRQLGAVRFPFHVHFDWNDTTFRYTRVVQNQPLADSEFLEKPERP
jgi:hypothetical protein